MNSLLRAATGAALLCLMLAGAAHAVDPGLGRLHGPEGSLAGDEEVRQMLRQAVSLGVREGDLSDVVAGCKELGFDVAGVRRVLSLLTKAKLAGLPAEELVNKFREGVAKKVSPEAIEKALEGRAQVLRRAKSLTDSLVAEGRAASDYQSAVKMVADALDAGASSADVLRAVREGRALAGAPDLRAVFRKTGERK